MTLLYHDNYLTILTRESAASSAKKGRKSKHAQRIAAATAAARQSPAATAAHVKPGPGQVSGAQQGGIPPNLVERDPQWQKYRFFNINVCSFKD
jgi:Spy/CpxP family protein refolding chaperone